MITWHSRKRDGHYLYNIYENLAEAEQAGIKPVRLEECKVGDYVMSDNGYFIPVTQRYTVHAVNSQNLFVCINFPNYQYKNRLYTSSMTFKYRPFMWSREPREEYKKKFVSSKDKLFAFYISEGMPVEIAAKLCWSVGHIKTKREQILRRLFDSEDFINYLRKLNIVETLKEKYKKNKVDEKYLIDIIKSIAEDKQAAASLRQYAIETIRVAVLPDEPKLNTVIVPYEGRVNALPENTNATDVARAKLLATNNQS